MSLLVERVSKPRADAVSRRMPNQFQPSQSKLLSLPGELRNKIWEIVLGNRTIHIVSGVYDEDTITLSVCESELSTAKAHKIFTSSNPDKEYFSTDTKHSARWASKT